MTVYLQTASTEIVPFPFHKFRFRWSLISTFCYSFWVPFEFHTACVSFQPEIIIFRCYSFAIFVSVNNISHKDMSLLSVVHTQYWSITYFSSPAVLRNRKSNCFISEVSFSMIAHLRFLLFRKIWKNRRRGVSYHIYLYNYIFDAYRFYFDFKIIFSLLSEYAAVDRSSASTSLLFFTSR